ncbi:type II secretion system F family protein [Paenisporosarcina sp. TG20]|uniref:type II secretion system F family protein n=1 Tax=Paenisporosarcina sp. TG20 TaxID=1211706 RepID=UPI0003054DC9|nr:type II secretion system F family protein [Paenisporosarcina sp. TG20]
MARFQYVGRDRKSIRKGIMQAANQREAIMKLRDDGIRITEIKKMADTALQKEISIGNPVKREQFIMFLRQFATLMRAGVTIVDSCVILSQQVESKALRRALIEIADDLKSGNSLSEAVRKFPRIFEPLVINLMQAGELTGSIDESLDRLATHFEKAYVTRQKVVSAMTYPLIVAVLAVGVVIFLLTSIVPMFVEMFSSFGGELPLLTRFVMGASDFVQNYWYILIAIAVLFSVGLWMVKRDDKGRYMLHSLLLRMPVFGNILKKAALARMTRTLSSLFSSSVPILVALTMVERVVGNEVIGKVILQARDGLERGESMTGPMMGHWAFPPLIPHMISIGEQTGALDHMLERVAEFYEKEVDAETDKLKAMIEPLMIVLLAGLVGTIVMAIMLPMFGMFENMDNM